MLENNLRKTGTGLALICALLSDCGVVATQRNYFRQTLLDSPVVVEVKGYTPKKVEFYLTHPKKADLNKDGMVKPEELKNYIDAKLADIKSTYSR